MAKVNRKINVSRLKDVKLAGDGGNNTTTVKKAF